jgi:hypothetical protein
MAIASRCTPLSATTPSAPSLIGGISPDSLGDWSMARFYKGVAPGTYWADPAHDPTRTGFTPSSSAQPTRGAFIDHVAVASRPSPFISATLSWAVAVDYARGPSAPGFGARSPGFVYIIDTDVAGTQKTQVFNPIEIIAAQMKGKSQRFSHEHDGDSSLILGLASPTRFAHILTAPPARPGSLAPLPNGPTISRDLWALVNAVRDAEVLFTFVPPACVVGRQPVP